MVNYDVKKAQIISELDSIRRWVVELDKLTAEHDDTDQFFKFIFLNLPVAIYVAQDGLIQFINKQLEIITGYSAHELVGTDPLNLVLPEYRDIAKENIVKMLGEEQAFNYEFRIATKKGTVKWVMQLVTPTSYQGKPAVIVNLIDITEHKQGDEDIKRSEDRYRDLCNNTGDMIQCINQEGKFTYVNNTWREQLGYTDEEITHLSLFEIIHPDYVQHFLELFQRAMSGEKINDIEVAFIDHSGNRVDVEGNLNCRIIEDKPVYTRGVFRDITGRKMADEKNNTLLKNIQEINRGLEQSNRELEDFAYIASHDLREPLRKISSFGSLLEDSLKGKLDEDQKENLDFMIEGARRMQVKIDDLLTYSRITTAAKPFQVVDLNEIIENLKDFELSSSLNATKGTINIQQELLTVYGDPSQIQQLMQNLIGNGLKFHRDGIPPIINIRTSRAANSTLRVTVEDNGIGISEEYHQQIFVMFKRLHSPTDYEGTGIGLALCKKIIHRHGGDIGVRSAPGEGSTFWFTLPRFGSEEHDQNKESFQ
jgi:PAS domain S-box-containing protein